MLILGCRVGVSEWDGLPIKDKLPDCLQELYATRKQWLFRGFEVSPGAKPVPMHPNAMNKKLVEYFYRDDVRPIASER